MHFQNLRITDTDARSYRKRDFGKVLLQHKKEKKDKYLRTCLELRKDFMPMVHLVDTTTATAMVAVTGKGNGDSNGGSDGNGEGDSDRKGDGNGSSDSTVTVTIIIAVTVTAVAEGMWHMHHIFFWKNEFKLGVARAPSEMCTAKTYLPKYYSVYCNYS